MDFTNRRLVQTASGLLKELEIETAMLDAQLLLAHVLKKERLEVQLAGSNRPNDQEIELFFKLLARRMCFEPVAYILGEKEFYGASFKVSNDCLIPRPDTEMVVEQCLKLIKDGDRVFELCTGSGAIAITLLLECPKLEVWASDISPRALAIALENSQNLGVDERLKFLQGDLFEPFKGLKPADLIVINPPYIATVDVSSLSPSVKEYEPKLALDGGADGLDFYRRILTEASNYLVIDGFLVLEIGFDQGESLKSLALAHGWSGEIFKDLAGLDRGIVLQKLKTLGTC